MKKKHINFNSYAKEFEENSDANFSTEGYQKFKKKKKNKKKKKKKKKKTLLMAKDRTCKWTKGPAEHSES